MLPWFIVLASIVLLAQRKLVIEGIAAIRNKVERKRKIKARIG